MNKTGTVDRVFAVVAGIVMAAGGIKRALAHEGKKLRRGAGERRCALRSVVRVRDLRVVRNRIPRKAERRRGHDDAGGSSVANVASEARVGHYIIGPATLVVKAERVSAREGHANAFTDHERQGSSHARNDQTILARS